MTGIYFLWWWDLGQCVATSHDVPSVAAVAEFEEGSKAVLTSSAQHSYDSIRTLRRCNIAGSSSSVYLEMSDKTHRHLDKKKGTNIIGLVIFSKFGQGVGANRRNITGISIFR